MRLKYIDCLKGIAIFMVVIGHVLVANNRNVENNSAYSLLLINFVYAFHTQLFMFMSGYVMDLNRNKIWNKKLVALTVKKRVISLLIPTITFTIIAFSANRGFVVPWFLRCLFEITLLFCLLSLIGNYFKLAFKYQLIIYIFGYVLILLFDRITKGTLFHNIMGMTYFHMWYPYFILGHVFHRYNIFLHMKKFDIYAIALICFGIMYYNYYFTEQPKIVEVVTRYILAISGILIIYFFVRVSNSHFILYKVFAYIGKFSLHIYLLSDYFIPHIIQVGNIIANTASYNDIVKNTTTFYQLTMGVLLTTYVILMCLFIVKVIEKSRILNLICFGKQN